jgi:MFS family permease
MQTTSAFLLRVFPVIGPALTNAAGVDHDYVGYLSALNSLGTMWYLAAAGDLLPKFGPIRTLQIGSAIAAVALLAAIGDSWWAISLSAFLIGFGYGPSPTAGSDLLKRFAPKHHISLVFSVKQSGVPLGGVLAGLLLPPILSSAGWVAACIAATGVALVAILAVEPIRRDIDHTRDHTRPVRLGVLFDIRMLAFPFQTIGTDKRLVAASALSISLAVVQGSVLAFFVTYLAVELEFSLTVAGVSFAIMQVTGAIGRVAIGWISDRNGSPQIVLLLLSLASAATVGTITAVNESWQIWAIYMLAAVTGLAIISWNGVFMAMISGFAPPGRVGEFTAATTFVTFIGYVVGPASFSGVLALGLSYQGAFLLLGIVLLISGGMFAWDTWYRREPSRSRMANRSDVPDHLDGRETPLVDRE